MVKIQAGCTRDRLVPNQWVYAFQNNEGYFEIRFMAQPDERPEIGDFIANNQLVKRDGYQINNDHRMWKDRFSDTRARDKMDPPETW